MESPCLLLEWSRGQHAGSRTLTLLGPAFGQNLKAPLVDVVVIGPKNGREGGGRDGAICRGVANSRATQLSERRDLGLHMEGEIVLADRLGIRELGGALGGDQLHLLRGTVEGDVVDAQVPVVVSLGHSVESGGEESGL